MRSSNGSIKARRASSFLAPVRLNANMLTAMLTLLLAVEQVEKDAETSLIPKETPKEPASKRASGRAARRSGHPLFDINPRTAKEFLRRAQEKNIENVKFQLLGEEFSQWKEEEEKEAAKVESPTAPPTSFADALLRKLNFKEGSDDANAKGARCHS